MRYSVLIPLLLAAGCSNGVNFPATGSTWPQPVVPDFAHKARFAISINLDDRVGFVNADVHAAQSFGTMPVGDVPVELEGPHHIAASPDGKYIYINLSNYVPGSGTGPHGSHGTGTVPGSLLKLDAATGERVGEVLVDRNPGDVILDSTGKYAFISHYDYLRLETQLSTAGADPTTGYSAVAVVDTESMTRISLTPVCPTLHGMGLSPDEKTLYAVCSLADSLAVIDVSDKAHPAVKQVVPVGANAGVGPNAIYQPYAVGVSPADGTVWIADTFSGDVRVYDSQKSAMDDTRTISLGGLGQPFFARFTKDGKTLLVPHQGDDALSVVDPATSKILQTVPFPTGSCLHVHAIQLTPDEQGAVAVCEGDHVTKPGTIVFLTMNPLTVTGFVQMGLYPDGAAWLPPIPQQ